jgi:hypothetical protein
MLLAHFVRKPTDVDLPRELVEPCATRQANAMAVAHKQSQTISGQAVPRSSGNWQCPAILYSFAKFLYQVTMW